MDKQPESIREISAILQSKASIRNVVERHFHGSHHKRLMLNYSNLRIIVFA